MQSKRDQVQAHTFIMSRLASGMLLGDPDAPESPLGRTTRGTFIGVIVTVVIAAGSLLFGLISPGGNNSWRTANSLIVNADTGARYLFIGSRLRPVRNYASALLIGGTKLKTTNVRTASLRGTPIGTLVGIPGAPDRVPASGDLDGGPWLVCSTLGAIEDQATGRGTSTTVTTLVVGAPADGQGMGDREGLLVRGPDKATYLVWRGSRLRLDKKTGAAVSFGYGSVTPRPVSAAFLDALVPGADLAPPAVPGRGDKGPSLGGKDSTVGQVFQVRVPGAAPTYYLLGKAGLAPITAAGAALVLGDPATREKAYGGVSPSAMELSADALREHQAAGSEGKSPASAGLPPSPPRATTVPEDRAACARVQPDGGGTKVATVLVSVKSLTPLAPAEPDDVASPCLSVNATVVRPGHGALIRALTASGTKVGDTTYLVSDNGIKYRVPNAAALKALGYTESDVKALPSPLLSMLPSGPALSPEAAAGGGTTVVPPSNCDGHSASSGAGNEASKSAPGRKS
ncbi:type VII secretion protein EccB [Streptomyces sp. ISID311]|uniref:type VII secretion protein EccB n=1 Tax=Streptomyces sp. ISID311 TaxID=2601673 RepID=UPI0011BD3511|nr:type VII secretion protein EccB [Streptomyces sp. ISID311]TXC99883.1 type VII secretion protein EccB [Streptomyces sp. ISID311]